MMMMLQVAHRHKERSDLLYGYGVGRVLELTVF
jgi:hypothetical protein